MWRGSGRAQLFSGGPMLPRPTRSYTIIQGCDFGIIIVRRPEWVKQLGISVIIQNVCPPDTGLSVTYRSPQCTSPGIHLLINCQRRMNAKVGCTRWLVPDSNRDPRAEWLATTSRTHLRTTSKTFSLSLSLTVKSRHIYVPVSDL